ncbi:MAG: hypothetical protein AAF939_17420 [Planctomycetota bacterium]
MSQANSSRRPGSGFTPQITRIVLILLASVFGLAMLQFDSYANFMLALLVIFFVLAVWTNRITYLYIILGTVLTLKIMLMDGPPGIYLAPLMVTDVGFAVALLLFAAFSFRYFELTNYIRTFYPETMDEDLRYGKSFRHFPNLFRGRWWLLPLAIFGSFLILGFIPYDTQYRYDYRILPAPARLIFLFGFLFLIWFLTRSFFLLLSRWNMTAEQGDLISRANYIREYWYELQAVEKRRNKYLIRNSED